MLPERNGCQLHENLLGARSSNLRRPRANADQHLAISVGFDEADFAREPTHGVAALGCLAGADILELHARVRILSSAVSHCSSVQRWQPLPTGPEWAR